MKIIDLTLELRHGLKTYVAHPPVEINEGATFASTGARYIPPCCGYETNHLSFSDHSGTHIDAPNHFVAGKDSVEQLPLDKLVGQALMLDCSDKPLHSEPVTAAILEAAELRQGIAVQPGDIVLIRTYPGEWGDELFFEAQSLSGCAARWLAEKRIAVLGLDLPNADDTRDMARPVHMELLSRDIYIIENVCYLDQLPRDKRFAFAAAPLRLKGATASPVRAYAVVEE